MEKENKEKKKIILLIVPLLIIIFCLIGYIIYSQTIASKESPEYKTSGIQVAIGTKDEKSDTEQRMTKIIGDNLNNIDYYHQYIYLQNDPDNHVFLQFDIYEGEELLYSSNLIEPNNMERINVYKMLDKGPHTLNYFITSHSLEDMSVMLSGIKQIKKIYIS